MLLIHPPQVRNCEPPVALTRLAGALKEAGEEVTLVDGALEGFLWLCSQPPGDTEDPQARLVRRKKDRILNMVGSTCSRDRYIKQVSDIKRLAATAKPVTDKDCHLTPADFQDPGRSPLKSEDLILSWKRPEEDLFYPWFSRRIAELLEKGVHSHVGISIGYLSQALTGMAICGFIKKQFPRMKIQLGGGLINSWVKGPSDTRFLSRLADGIQSGEGEKNIVEFTGRVYCGPGLPFFGDLYNPSIHGKYLSPVKILPYAASTGCSWKRCTFCSENWEDNAYCEVPPARVEKELKALCTEHKPDLIHFCDSEISRQLLQVLLKRPPDADWYGFSRFIPEMTGAAYCRKLAASGCRMLCMGLESGDQDVLDSLKKGINLEQVSIILKNLKDAGIKTFIYIMFGTPAEDRTAAFRTRDFVLSHSAYIDYLNVSIFNMPVGSEEALNLKTRSFYEGDLALYREFVHPAGWNRGEIREFLSREFKKVPELREILKRTPPVFTSSHAALLPV